MAEPKDAINAVSPALQHTLAQLFKPFRFWVWLRLALLGLLTGDFSGGGSGSRAFFQTGGNSKNELRLLEEFTPQVLLLAVGLAIAVVAIALFLLYLSAVCRFILFDAVLRDRWRLREGFQRWQRAGWSFFGWQLALAAAVIGFLLIVVGIPVLLALATGLGDAPARALPWIVLGVVIFFLVVIPVFIAVAIAAVLARDFVIPIMAMEEVGMIEGWKRFLLLLRGDAASYLVYLLCRIVLALVSAFLFGLLTLIALLFPLLIFGAMGAAAFLTGLAAGLSWNLFTISAAVLLGLAALLTVLALSAFISTPSVVFFQAYSIHFFCLRYAPLDDALLAGPFGPRPDGSRVANA